MMHTLINLILQMIQTYWIYLFIPDAELPENQQALELIQNVRTGKTVFYTLLMHYGKDNITNILSKKL